MSSVKKDKLTIGITFGAFELCHAGHVAMLEECMKHCHWLIVGLHTDPTIDRPTTKNKPVQTTFERWMQLQALKAVDEVIPYDTEQDLLNMLSMIHIDKRFIGSDYAGQILNGQEICDKKGIEIIFIDRMHNYSSSELRKRLHNESH